MTTNYKRTIIQIPLEDVKSFEDYANKYGLSFSSSIVMLAKKAIEYEQTVALVPQILDAMKTEEALQRKETKKNAKKSKK